MAAVAGICPDWSGVDVSFEIRRMRVRAEERVSPSDVPDPPRSMGNYRSNYKCDLHTPATRRTTVGWQQARKWVAV